uniref:Uncharacterized protein n=1 Tax=Rhizophora mucronata TaxID=61149 RepID=A0A2P2NSQ9_RHIMU
MCHFHPSKNLDSFHFMTLSLPESTMMASNNPIVTLKLNYLIVTLTSILCCNMPAHE